MFALGDVFGTQHEQRRSRGRYTYLYKEVLTCCQGMKVLDHRRLSRLQTEGELSYLREIP